MDSITAKLFVQTGVTFIAASLGAIFGAFLTRRTERFKHVQQLRSNAYVDFLRGFAKVAGAQQNRMRGDRAEIEEQEGRILVTDARSRIVVYGSTEVVQSLAKFITLGTQTHSLEGQQAFVELCALMRTETAKPASGLDIVLFS